MDTTTPPHGADHDAHDAQHNMSGMSGMNHNAMNHDAGHSMSDMNHDADHDMHHSMNHAMHDHEAHDHSMHDMGSMSGMNHDMGDMGNMGGGMDHMHHGSMFKRLFWISVVLAIPTIALDPMFAHLLGYHVPQTLPLTLIPAALGTVMYFWTGLPFLKGAASEIKSRTPGMMLLISLGITVAFVASWLATLGVLPSSMSFWWELALLVVIMLAGHWIEMNSVMSTSSALDSISALLPTKAHVLADGETHDVELADITEGDIVVVRPGEAIPSDGTVVEGRAEVNESMITGESMPVTRGKGDKVVAGSISTDSSLQIRVDAVGEKTALSTIRRLVEEAQTSKTPTQLLADKAAALLFWYALIAAAITAVVWLSLSQPQNALERVVTVLVIACPHALGLAIPLVVSIAMGGAAKQGILIARRDALETLQTLDTVVFDKTGTLTLGSPRVTKVRALSSTAPAASADGSSTGSADTNRILALAAAAEQESEHPLATAIRTHAEQELGTEAISRLSAGDFTSAPGIGVSATVDGTKIEVGGPQLLDKHHLDASEVVSLHGTDQHGADQHSTDHDGTNHSSAESASENTATTLYVLEDGTIIGSISIADTIRSESPAALRALKAQGIETVMLTGDSEAVADSVAKELGIEKVFAQVLPEEKDTVIATLQKDGRKVAMVGDGVNDAPALARADVGIAIGAGTDVAIDSADVILSSSDPSAVAAAISLSRKSVRKMHQNLWWAAGYNLISVPLAAGVLAPIGFTMPMSVGAILMAVSTVIVVLNARLLKRQLALPAQPTAPAPRQPRPASRRR